MSRRGGLFRKYVFVLVTLVTAALLASGIIEIWFSYGENKAALLAIQNEQALGAAARIEAFVKEIERQMGWTTQLQLLGSEAAIAQQRIDFIRLQKQVPAITELSHLDATGKEQLLEHRLSMSVVGSQTDFSRHPKFTEARRGTWFGPVYFRKESEPYMTIAMPVSGGGVTVAEVNLKFIWDVVSQIRVGTAGRAFVVDGQGQLIAHPDISLVLQKTSLATLPQVRAALAAPEAGERVPIAKDNQGGDVLTSYTVISPLRWAVFVEQPLEEAFAPLRASITRTAVLVLLGIGGSVVASVLLVRRMVRPIHALQEGAARIGAGELGHRLDVRTGDEIERLAGEFNRMTERLRESHATLERRVEERTRELSEALEQQTATSEILRVISSSPTDMQPVFEAILARAMRLCDAHLGVLQLVEDSHYRAAAHQGATPDFAQWLVSGPRPIDPGTAIGRALLECRPVHVPDVMDDDAYRQRNPARVATVELGGARTFVAVPMVKEGRAVGSIGIYRREVRPFSDNQIQLVQTFADQAVIAVENVRLFTELQARNRELTTALDQQTATAEILRVISRSYTDVRPVFQTIVDSATRLLRGHSAVLSRIVDERIDLAAYTHTGEAGDALLESLFPMPLHSGGADPRPIRERVIGQRIPYNVADVETDPRVGERGRANARARGYRSQLVVPMLRDDEPIGTIAVTRAEPGAFTDEEIALLQTFADQAVIAIENVRLFTELQEKNRTLTETLEQQTATAEILRVISGSPTNVQPVFDAIAASALHLLHGWSVVVSRVDGQRIYAAAIRGGAPGSEAAVRELIETLPRARGTYVWDAILDREVKQIADVEAEEVPPAIRAGARARGWRANLAVPMLQDGQPIGLISVSRQQPGPFAPHDVQLLKTFADQAVIAIENVRLFTELQQRNAALTQAHRQVSETLEQQTAMSEILKAISGAPGDVQPVFDAIARNAVRLCGAFSCRVFRVSGDLLHVVGEDYETPEAREKFYGIYPEPIGAGGPSSLAVRERRIVQDPDIANNPTVPSYYRERAVARGYRALMAVPMLRDDVALGVITVSRNEPLAFSPPQVELLKTFADQAVIAIENVRLFTELQEKNRAVTEALEQQTATAEILGVISSSPTDVQPVLDAVAASAARLCGAVDALIMRVEGDVVRRVAHFGTITSVSAVRPLTPGTPSGRAILERRTIHVDDILVEFEAGDYLEARALHEATGFRTLLSVPLVREDAVIGVITIRRLEARPFTAKQIALVKTFADQAVIAIENVRLFTELQEKNEALSDANAQVTEALSRQTATADILRVISSSPTDVRPVFDAIVQTGARLCSATLGFLLRFDGQFLTIAADWGATAEDLETVRQTFPRPAVPNTLTGRAILERAVVHMPDIRSDPTYRGTAGTSGRWRTGLGVPLLRDDKPIGALAMWRTEARPFDGREIELLKTFADQAVIAVENVRLFNELQARTAELTRSVDQLTALGEVSRAVSSTLDLDRVLSTVVSRASQLAAADGCSIYEYDEAAGGFRVRATSQLSSELIETQRAAVLHAGEGAVGRLVETREPVQIPDIAAERAYDSPLRDALLRGGHRALLAVPMLHEDRVVGGLVVSRMAPGEFPAETVELLKTFANQSALAIQNARLFREIEQKSGELEVANRHKSEFLASMSHELRTPLNAVIGFSEVLLERMFGELNDKQEEYLRDIYSSGRHLLSLINDILDLAKIEAGRMELDAAQFDLPQAIENAVTLVRGRADAHAIRLDTQIDPRLGDFLGDERKVKQILLNLLSNAVKFTPEGGRITLRAAAAHGSVEISVTDTGIGIAPEDQAAVFEEFRQVGTDYARKREGTGLGLALTKRFVELHGGTIWLKSALGEGSTFTFTLPVRPWPTSSS